MRPPLSRLAALGAYVAACFLIWLSYSSYSASFTPVGRWQAATNDPADYRFIAEYFWGVPFHPETYDSIWHGGWGDYLRLIPFRSIGLGSFYLLAGWLRLGHAPSTPDEVIAAGIALAYAQKVLLAIALIVLFAVVRRRWNTALALFAVVVTAFPPIYWRISDDFLTEPPQRIAFLLAFACAIALSGPRRASDEPQRAVPGVPAARALARGDAPQGPVVRRSDPAAAGAGLRNLDGATLVSRRALALAAAALLVPVSVIAVNWIGWRTTTLSPGFGLHANLRYEGDVLREYSADHGNRAGPTGLRGPRAAAAPLVAHLRRARGDSRTSTKRSTGSDGNTCVSARARRCATSGPACGSRRRYLAFNESRRAASGSSRSTRHGPRWFAGSTSRSGSCSASGSLSRRRVSPVRWRSSCGSSRPSATSSRRTS